MTLHRYIIPFSARLSRHYLWPWILCGLPFGIWRLRLWIITGGGSLGGGIALFALNFILSGIIGGFVLVWRLIVAVWLTFTLISKLFSKKQGHKQQ